MKGASAHNNSRSQSQVLSFVSRQRTDTGILKRRKFFDTFKVSRQMTPHVSEDVLLSLTWLADLFSWVRLLLENLAELSSLSALSSSGLWTTLL